MAFKPFTCIIQSLNIKDVVWEKISLNQLLACLNILRLFVVYIYSLKITCWLFVVSHEVLWEDASQ